MKLIEPPSIVDSGIAIYIPYSKEISGKNLNVSISYFSKNPRIPINCGIQETKLWSTNIVVVDPGSLVIYRSPTLQQGFYTITINSVDNTMGGQEQYTLINNEASLIIGLPYSAYPPIVIQ